MKYPEYRSQSRDTYMVSNFGGYNGRERISDYEFSAMENMSSRSYPLLRPRERRGSTPDAYVEDFLGGFVADSPLGEVYGVVTGLDIHSQSSLRLHRTSDHKYGTLYGIDGHKGEARQFATMGAEVIMFPDKLKLSFGDEGYNGLPEVKRESLENETVTVSGLPDGWKGSVGYWYVDPANVNDGDNDGISIPETTWASREPPADPENGQWWLDNSNTMSDPYRRGVGVVRRYSAAQETWVDVYPTYVKMRFPGIGKGFKAGDFVNISQESGISGALKSIFGDREIVLCGDDYIVVEGSVANTEHASAMLGFVGITVKRSVPDLDYITEAGNRLWGCRNEYRDGKIINEIYVSALGDPTNWSKYDGITSDSYAVTIGIGGAFTGAATYNDVPHFFKENAIIKVYGNAPSNYETVALRCDGVEEGSSRSIVNVDGRLFYKSRRGIMVYGGGYPSLLTDKLGEERYKNAVGGELFGRYYVSMEDSEGTKHLFVYDTASGLLHREDDIPVSIFLRAKSKLIALNGKYVTVVNPDGEELEETFEWCAVTGEMGLDDPDNKYFSRVRIRADIPRGAYLEVSFRYNGKGTFVDSARFNGEGLGTSLYMVRPARCDTMEVRLRGKGDVKIYSVTYNYERGTDV